MKLSDRFSSFECGDCRHIDGCVILVDEVLEPADEEKLRVLKTIGGQNLILLLASDLAVALENFLADVAVTKKDTLFVFPGNGSNWPKKFSRICQNNFGVSVYAKRFWTPGRDPVASAGLIMPEIFMNLQVKTIVVVDDVISSGKTMNKLWQNNAWRFPRAKWIGATWLAQIPQMRSNSGIKGYDQIFASLVLEGSNQRKVPINSLSTLIEQPTIAQSYAQRHFARPEEFTSLMSFLYSDDTGILCH